MADAVIIGAGHNSLACACHLAARGWSVEIFEQAAEPGGAVKTGEYTLPGFRHDWGAMNLSLFAGSSFFRENAGELERHGLRFAPAPDPFASAFPGGRWLGISRDAALTAARVGGFSAADARAWRRLAGEFPPWADRISRVLATPMRGRPLAALLWRLLRAAGTGGTLDLARFMAMSPRAWLDATFESGRVKAALAAWGMHLDFAPDIAGGAVFPYLEAMAGQAHGMVLGRGGARVMIDAMAGMLEERGGRIHCGARVTGIERDGGRAAGVVLADGRRARARRAVIANVAPGALRELAGGAQGGRHDAGLGSFQHAPGTMMIHLAMDALPGWTAPELGRFAYVHLAPSMAQMSRAYSEARDGLLPGEPVIVCGQPTVFDPTRAPAGKHVLWLQVRMVPGAIRGDARGEIGARDWEGAAGPFADRVLDLLERYAPGTRARVLGRHVVTPDMLEKDNPNLVGGDQICGSHHLHQHFHNRPVRGFADGRTPVAGLYHTGAAVWPGAGTGAGPGTMLARKLAGR